MIGLCSLICLGLCLWYAFSQSLGLGLTFMIVDLVALPLTAALALSLWSRTPLGRRLFLRPPAAEEIDVSHPGHHLAELVGDEGLSLTALHPCGHVQIRGRRLDALAEEGFVPEGARVVVLRVRSGQLVVRGLLGSTAEAGEAIHHGGEPAGAARLSSPASSSAANILEETP
jgi:membrane-bound ClpP family serine protease